MPQEALGRLSLAELGRRLVACQLLASPTTLASTVRKEVQIPEVDALAVPLIGLETRQK